MSNKEKLQKRILVVDDNLAMRKMLESMITSLGYHDICSASDGESGWEKILEGDIDIVISDYIMPGLNGLQFLHRIRSSKKFFNLPFIMITGADNWGDFINTVQAKAKEIGNFQKSKFFYLSALKLSPQAKEVNFNIAFLLYEQGEYDNSMAYTSKALRLHPDFPEAKELMNSLRLKMDQLSP